MEFVDQKIKGFYLGGKPGDKIVFKYLKTIGLDGKILPLGTIPPAIIGNDGYFEATLKTVQDYFVKVRCSLPNGEDYKFPLPPTDGDWLLTDLINLPRISENLPSELELNSLLDTKISQHASKIATDTILGHIKIDNDTIRTNEDGQIYSSATVNAFTFVQNSPSDLWIINHNLGYFPLCEIFSSSGERLLTDLVHFSVNQTRLFFQQPTAGSARLI